MIKVYLGLRSSLDYEMDVDRSLLLPCSPVADLCMLDWYVVFLKNRGDAVYQHGVQGDFTPITVANRRIF